MRATVDWIIRDDGGKTVRTVMNGEKHDAGDLHFTWDGRNDSAQPLPNGVYWIVTTAKTARGTETQQSRISVGPVQGRRRGQLERHRQGEARRGQRTGPDAEREAQAVGRRQGLRQAPWEHGHALQGQGPVRRTSGTIKVIVNGTDAAGNSEQQTFMVPLH